ncbi:MAG: Asp23/Gls24 family envelope stress response protein [Clostridia bacterium]|nr:Asp23/Gls24 family envelope stress response protein [Clostridia bacterium]
MSVRTNNIYGKIVISDKTIKRFVAHVATDCYGVVEFMPKRFVRKVVGFFKFKSDSRGVKVRSFGDRIFIDVCVAVKFGVSIKAVVEALKESVKYKVERFTGMVVDTINVKVTGVRA